jgi:hypothetical protein
MLIQNPILIKPAQLYKIVDDALQISLKAASYYKYPYTTLPAWAITARTGIISYPSFCKISHYKREKLIGRVGISIQVII